jgi:hypothetical protein
VSWLLSGLALVAQVGTAPQPMSDYHLGLATGDGAKLTVAKLLQATKSKDDAAYDTIARGMVIMLAPDFGMPVDRTKFAQSLADCTNPQVVSSRPFPKMPDAQAVRIAMQCTNKDHAKPLAAIADIMADNEHTFMVLPGGVERVWPTKKGNR